MLERRRPRDPGQAPPRPPHVTAYGALDCGHDLTLVADAQITGPVEFGEGSVVEVVGVVREINAVLRWLSHPAGTSQVAADDEVDYGVGT